MRIINEEILRILSIDFKVDDSNLVKVRFADVVFIIDLKDVAIYYHGNRLSLDRSVRKYNKNWQKPINKLRTKKTLLEITRKQQVLQLDYCVDGERHEVAFYFRVWFTPASFKCIGEYPDELACFKIDNETGQAGLYLNNLITPWKTIEVI